MRLGRVRPMSRTPWASLSSRRRTGNEDGFTLIEMIIVALILPVVIGAVTYALIAVFSLQNGVSGRIGDSGDAESVSQTFEQDVQTADMITTSASAPQCGTGTQLLGLEWGYNQQAAVYETVVTYVETLNTTGTSGSLVRQYCASGPSSTPTGTSILAFDIQPGQGAPTVSPSTLSPSPSSGWVPATEVTGVSFNITEPGSGYNYTLAALPGASSSSSQLSTVNPPTTTCGFATPSTGTYASTLCFVDFTGFSAPATGCKTVSAGIVNTPYTMSFCVAVSGGAVAPASIPTYFSPPTSEAFLGNNGFYTGIPGNPALYQTTSGTTSKITITNIQVLDANGNQATGWELVSGDAESTDSNESLTWTSNTNLNLLPDSPTSSIGNACAAPTGSNPSAIDLTGLGTTTVECAATVSSDKTGTVMLEAAAPSSLTVTMVGAGLQAIFVGMLLP